MNIPFVVVNLHTLTKRPFPQHFLDLESKRDVVSRHKHIVSSLIIKALWLRLQFLLHSEEVDRFVLLNL